MPDVSQLAAAIGEPARARILYCLMDGHARTSTELAVVAGVSPSTTSVHLGCLKRARLVSLQAQGKHRYYSLADVNVARALEALNVLAGRPRSVFIPNTPTRLRAARTCYDHLAGTVSVQIHDRLQVLGWLTAGYEVTASGVVGLAGLGVDVKALRNLRRRFAYACLDWSERRPHIGGALGAGLHAAILKRKWIAPDLDSRAVAVTSLGRRELASRLGVQL